MKSFKAKSKQKTPPPDDPGNPSVDCNERSTFQRLTRGL